MKSLAKYLAVQIYKNKLDIVKVKAAYPDLMVEIQNELDKLNIIPTIAE